MFVFIIPLKSQARTDSWKRLSLIFERTLKSICSQTSQDFRVIVVCNQKPDVNYTNSAVEYVEVEDKPSEFGAKDKWRKIKLGLVEALKYNPLFVMHCDADDCISNKLVAFSEKDPNAVGWYFPQGWFWKEGSNLILHKNPDFHTLCGTCRIIRFELLKDQLQQEYPLFSHKETLINGSKLNPLPFKGTVYIMGHGENLFANEARLQDKKRQKSLLRRLKDMRHYRPLTGNIRQEFGLYNISDS